MDIFRGRYRESFEQPAAHRRQQGAPVPLRAAARRTTCSCPGHRIMVQIQSSWFPLYDRNPQTFVPNIFFAKPGDYRKATQRVYHSGDRATFIDLPVVGN